LDKYSHEHISTTRLWFDKMFIGSCERGQWLVLPKAEFFHQLAMSKKFISSKHFAIFSLNTFNRVDGRGSC
jgi:hypothetical protein